MLWEKEYLFVVINYTQHLQIIFIYYSYICVEKRENDSPFIYIIDMTIFDYLVQGVNMGEVTYRAITHRLSQRHISSKTMNASMNIDKSKYTF